MAPLKSNRYVLTVKKQNYKRRHLFLIVPDTHSLTSELRRIFIIPLCPVRCRGEASFEESRFTTMPVNTRACPCDKLQMMQPGFNNLRANSAHKPLHKAPWSQRASAIVQRRGFRWHREGGTLTVQKLSLTPATFTGPTPIQQVQVSCSVDRVSWDCAPPQPANCTATMGQCASVRNWCHITRILFHPREISSNICLVAAREQPHTTLGQSVSKRGGTALQMKWKVEVWVLHFFSHSFFFFFK